MIRTDVRKLLAGLMVLAVIAQPAMAAQVRVEVDGIKGAYKKNVLARLSIRSRSQKEALEDALVKRLHKEAESEIADAMQPYGFYSPTVKSTLEKKGETWLARYEVDRGEFTRITSITVRYEGEGADFHKFDKVLTSLPLEQGKRLRHPDYETSKKRMRDAALSNGFLDATWKQSQIRVHPDKLESEIVLILETGPRFYFGEVSIEQDEFEPSFIDRYVNISTGEPFNPKKLLNQQFTLSDLGYFSTVEINPQRDKTGEDKHVPVLVTTSPRPERKWDVGLGYGTDTGARASLSTDWRHLNNMGHTLTTDFRLSEIRNSLGANYIIPVGNTPGEHFALSATSESEQLESGDTVKHSIGVALNRTPGDWKRSYYLTYANETSDFGDEIATSDLLTPGFSLSRTRADDPIFVNEGWYVFADVHGALNRVLSSTSFLQGNLLARGIYTPWKRVRMLARAEIGYSLVEEFSELPASERFFAGGDQSVRGYAYQSIGPRNSDGDVVGGRFLNVFSFETEFDIWNNIGAALFFDSGGVDNDPGPKLFNGVGAGLRYRAPIGSLQLDLAHPLDGDDSGVRLHIGIKVGV